MAAPFSLDLESAKFPAYSRMTPEERAVLEDDGKIHPTRWFRRENWGRIAAFLFFIVAVVLMDVFETPIVHALKPTATWMHDTPGGFLVPFFLCMLLCIPPLLGINIVLIIIGLSWSLPYATALGCAGVFFGELGTFYLFKFVARGRAAKLEEQDVEYAILARAIRDGGVKMACVSRYSVIPSHLLTALFSTCGVSVWTFVISAVVSLPRAFSVVLVGHALALSAAAPELSVCSVHHCERVPHTLVSDVVSNVALALSTVTTLLSGWYMARKQQQIKREVIRGRCERRMREEINAPARTASMESFDTKTPSFILHSSK